MNEGKDQDLTSLLAAAAGGDQAARDQFVEVTYSYLHNLAGRIMSAEAASPTLQPTLLVNEALLRLFSGQPLQASNRKHFLNIAARQMRRVLIDRARAHRSSKRQGAVMNIDDAPQISVAMERSAELVALDDALQALAEVDPSAAEVVEKKFFGGYTDEETAAILEISLAQVRRDWTYARAWLHEHLTNC
jgi:RNA polymerase sigma factor (TIGR02999 family)